MSELVWNILSNQALKYNLLSACSGAVLFYIYLLINGYLPLWFGPEWRDWSKHYWNEQANEIMKKLVSEQGYSIYKPKESTRNFLSVLNSTPDRRIRRALFFNRNEGRLIGLLHFGADVEGPPRCVHGGAIAAIIDAVLGVCAYRTARLPCLTANLTVNYVDKLPLGATCLIECWHVSSDGVLVSDKENVKNPTISRKLVFEFKLTSLSGKKIFSQGSALFINAAIPNPNKSIVPPFLRFNR